MIITKTPVRISIGGGGTDLPSYYKKFGSRFMSAAIDKYVYIIVQERKWYKEFLLKYSKTETVTKVSDIENGIIRECLRLLKVDKALEIVSISDVGGKTGLGSSGSFTVGLLHALHVYKGEFVSKQQLAEEACRVAIDILKQPSGKQDEYIAAFGGMRFFVINKNGKVLVRQDNYINEDFINELDHYLYMFHTGIVRDSSSVLKIQDKKTKTGNKIMIENLKATQNLGDEIGIALMNKNFKKFGRLLHKHWMMKRKRDKTTNPKIDKWYELARKNGALGGKIMGAGGGGFFLFYCDSDSQKLIKALTKAGLQHIPFGFDNRGTRLIAEL